MLVGGFLAFEQPALVGRSPECYAWTSDNVVLAECELATVSEPLRLGDRDSWGSLAVGRVPSCGT